jgi:hypothetical protein
MMKRPQKITFGQMRAMGIRRLLVYCSNLRCSHSGSISGDQWPDDIRLSDLDPILTCQACGIKGARVRVDLIGERDNQKPRPERGLAGRGSRKERTAENGTPAN